MNKQIDPSQIIQTGMAFWASKTLLSAVELGLFTKLGQKSLSQKELESELQIHSRSSSDFLDALVSLGFLAREGSGEKARYSNTPETGTFLDRTKPSYVGGILEMANSRLYPFWADLTEGLRTGKPQNEVKRAEHGKGDLFDTLYKDQGRLETFLSAMAGVQMGNFIALAEKFDFSKHKTVCDVGGASGALAIAVARKHPNVHCISFDLPAVKPLAERTVQNAGVDGKVSVQSGDFTKDPLPKADVITMGNILHDWGLETKKQLIRKAYDALPAGGAFIAIENVIDDDRRKNTFGLLMSLNMLIETTDGFDYTGAQFRSWCTEAGFKSTEVMPLAGPTSAAIAWK